MWGDAKKIFRGGGWSRLAQNPYYSDEVSVACFGVGVSVMFHLMFVYYTFSSVWVAEWQSFG